MFKEVLFDLFGRMPCNTFDVLRMLHHHPHTFEISIRLHCHEVNSVRAKQHIERHAPSHTQTVLSRLQLAKSVPVLEYATLLHSVSCPSNKLAHSHSPLPSSSASCSHIPMFASNDAVARVFPDGAQAIDRTVLVCPVGMVLI